MLLKIGDCNLPIVDEEIRQRELSCRLFAGRSLRSWRAGGGARRGSLWRLCWAFLRCGRFWFLPKAREIPDALSVAHQLNVWMHQFQGIYFQLLVQQGPELHAYSQLVRRGEGAIGGKVRIFRDRGVFDIESRREQTQGHIAQRDLPSQALLQFRLNLP